jgi:hypothetical protein
MVPLLDMPKEAALRICCLAPLAPATKTRNMFSSG